MKRVNEFFTQFISGLLISSLSLGPVYAGGGSSKNRVGAEEAGRSGAHGQRSTRTVIASQDSARMAKARYRLVERTLEPILQDYLSGSSSGASKSSEIFISYAWPKRQDETGIQPFLLKLASDLSRRGMTVHLDLLDLKPGSRIDDFMTSSIEASSSILMIGSPTYWDRATQETNVKYEYERILKGPSKVIPLLYVGELLESFATTFQAQGIEPLVDMRSQEGYYKQFPQLLEILHTKAGKQGEFDSERTRGYVEELARALQGITEEEVIKNLDLLEAEALRSEEEKKDQVIQLARNLPFDERFMPQDWHIPSPSAYRHPRTDLVNAIEEKLQEQGVLVLLGEAGVGKKTAALSYAQRAMGRYVFGAVVGKGGLKTLSKKLGYGSVDDLIVTLEGKKYLLLFENVRSYSDVSCLSRLPQGGQFILLSGGHKNHLPKSPVIVINPLTSSEWMEFFYQLSGREPNNASSNHDFKMLFGQLKHEEEKFFALASYARENPFFEPRCLALYTPAAERKACWAYISHWYKTKGRLKEGPLLMGEMVTGVLKEPREPASVVSLEERTRAHLLMPKVEELCEELKSAGATGEVFIEGPWPASRQALGVLHTLCGHLTRAGITVTHRLFNPKKEEGVEALEEALRGLKSVIIVGTPALKTPEGEDILTRISSLLAQQKVIPLLVEGEFDVFPETYKYVLIESAKDAYAYAESFIRLVERLVGDLGGKFTKIKEEYSKAIGELKEGITKEFMEKHGKDIEEQEIQKSQDNWLRIKNLIDTEGLESPPEVWSMNLMGRTYGRNSFLEKLDHLLAPLESASDFKQAVVVGFGGLGKSHMAQYYASNHQSRYTLGVTVNGASLENLGQDYQALCKRLKIRLVEGGKAIWVVKRYLEAPENSGWLMVVDNADVPNDIKPYLPSRGGHILITSRSPEWKKESIVSLPPLERKSSVALLEKGTKILGDEEGANQVCDLLGDHPLALRLANAYIRVNGLTSFQEYATLLSNSPSVTSEIAKTWTPTLSKIRGENPDAMALLEMLSLTCPDNVPHEFLYEWAKKLWDDASDITGWEGQRRLGEALGALTEHSIITEFGSTVSIHRLVQDSIRTSLTESEKIDHLSRMISTLDAGSACGKWYSVAGVVCQHAFDHERLLKERGTKLQSILSALGSTAIVKGESNNSRKYHQWQLKLLDGGFTKRTLANWTIYESLGLSFGAMGDYKQQVEAFKRALELNSSSPQLRVHLAITYGKLGDHEQEVVLLQEACKMAAKSADKLMVSLSEYWIFLLASAYGHLKNWDLQKETLQKLIVSEPWIYTLGPGKTLDASICLLSIAELCGEVGDYEQVIKLAPNLELDLWGGHYSRLAKLYGMVGDYSRELRFYQKALTREYMTGLERISIYSGQGQTYGHLEDPIQQQLNYQKAFELAQDTYIPECAPAMLAKRDLGEGYMRLGEISKARVYLQDSMESVSRMYIEPRERVRIYMIYGELCALEGNLQKALTVLKEGLEIQSKDLFPGHPENALLLRALAKVELDLKEPRGEAHLREAFSIQSEKLRETHPELSKTQDLMRAYGIS